MTKKEYILDFLKEINYAYNHPAMYDDLKRLLDEMEEEILESANCKWIPVTERLPEEAGMSRVKENKEVLDHFVKLVDMNMGSGSYEELVTWHLGAISSFLNDISKSLAVIADSMSSQTGSEGSDKE